MFHQETTAYEHFTVIVTEISALVASWISRSIPYLQASLGSGDSHFVSVLCAANASR